MPFLPLNPCFKGLKAIKDFKSFKSRIFRCLISILDAYFHFCIPKMENKCLKILLLKSLIAFKPLKQGFKGKKGILRHFKQIFKALDVLLILEGDYSLQLLGPTPASLVPANVPSIQMDYPPVLLPLYVVVKFDGRK